MSKIVGSGEDAYLVAGGADIGGPGWFYLLSIAHTKSFDGVLTFWGPNSSGYVFRLERAGRYSADQIAKHPDYNGDRTRAVPCDVVDALAIRVGAARGRGVDPAEGPEDHVVDFRHFGTLRRRT
jgi:hypothetical protein